MRFQAGERIDSSSTGNFTLNGTEGSPVAPRPAPLDVPRRTLVSAPQPAPVVPRAPLWGGTVYLWQTNHYFFLFGQG